MWHAAQSNELWQEVHLQPYTLCYMFVGGVDVVSIKHDVGGNYTHGGALHAAQHVIPRAKHTQQTKCVVCEETTRSFSNVIVVSKCVDHQL